MQTQVVPLGQIQVRGGGGGGSSGIRGGGGGSNHLLGQFVLEIKFTKKGCIHGGGGGGGGGGGSRPPGTSA